jgi:esterase/lipase
MPTKPRAPKASKAAASRMPAKAKAPAAPIPPHAVAPGYVMTREKCERARKVVAWWLKHSALNVKPVGGGEHLDLGDIFVFNHFTRFETIIASYLLYTNTGHFVRSVADRSLFKVGDWFSKVLRDVGAVPNNMDGLLPFLAAEILRGNKVVIFPEGGLVKDKHVVDDKGRLESFSGAAGNRRKQHRGAAVLAVILDLYKHQIRELEAAGDAERLEEWQRALGLASVEELLKKAHQPTRIVPGNITYFPIRTAQNPLSWGAEHVAKSAPQQLFEELVIEGNLLFRKTDMDVHFGAPLEAHPMLSRAERFMLGGELRKLASLHAYYALRQVEDGAKPGLAERRLHAFVNNQSADLRERYMQAIYRQTAININHVVSTLIMQLLRARRMDVPVQVFDRAVYMALKDLQTRPGLNLHCSISLPWLYKGVVDGGSYRYKGFLDVCAKAKLLKRTDTLVRLSHRLEDDFDMQDIRLENPIAMHANEAAAVPAIREAVAQALLDAERAPPQATAALLFSDMERDYRLKWTHYSRKAPAMTPNIAHPEDGAPFLLKPKGADKAKVPLAVVMVHGFSASPAELRGYADQLAALGHVVVGVRLPGHGTTPYDMEKRTRKDWEDAVREGCRIAAAYGERVAIVGYSTGGALALKLAGSEAVPGLVGVVSCATPVEVTDKNFRFLPWVMMLKTLLDWIPAVRELLHFYQSYTSRPDIKYGIVPVTGLNQLRLLVNDMLPALPKITVPVLVLQGDADETVEPVSADIIFAGLAKAERERHTIPGGRHGLILEDIGPTRSLITRFLARLAENPLQPVNPSPAAK